MSERIWVKRRGNVCGPYEKDGEYDFLNLPENVPLFGTFSQPPNPEEKQAYWSIMSRLARGIGKDKDTIDSELRVEAGHYTLLWSERHGRIGIPKSIADTKCDGMEFRNYMNAAIPLIPKVYGISLAEFDDLLKPLRKLK